MTARPDSRFAPATVRAAQAGDREALQRLLADGLPLVYNIVGCALQGHADVDDVVQETMLRVVRGLGDVRDPDAFRSWLVAVAIRQVRDLRRVRQAAIARTSSLDEAETVPDPAADFAETAILRLGLSGQRKEIAEATAWLDDGHREVLALWWLEEAGELDRDGLAASLGVPSDQAAVRVQRMKQQLTASRVVVRALKEPTRCHELSVLAGRWDGTRNPLWRKRLVGHTRDCAVCGEQSRDLIPAERLLASLGLVTVPVLIAGNAMRTATAAAATAAAAGGSAKALRFVTLKTSAIAVTVSVAAVTAGVVATSGKHGAVPVAAAPTSTSASAVPRVPAVVTTTSPTVTQPPVIVPKATTTSAVVKPVPSNAKKGVAAWTAPDFDQALTSSKASWYYDWSPSRIDQLSAHGPEFVPMIWGAKNADAATIATAKRAGTELLTFNEPDMSAQSNMTVQQALALWPELQATGMRLGSPAVAANAATPGGWLDQFMAGAAAKGYRVDFITVHWYGSDFRTAPAVDQLKSYLQAIHDRYHLPIWLTEYALIDFSGPSKYPTPPQQAAFVTASSAMLTGLPYVERYAWFGLAASGSETGTALFQGTTATPMGIAYENS
jgi:RNA polymerase sigma factor (sigma-70 family)